MMNDKARNEVKRSYKIWNIPRPRIRQKGEIKY